MFKMHVQQQMELFTLNKLDKGKEDPRRRQDPWELNDVIEQAEILAVPEETQPIIPGQSSARASF
uniref:Uncharacterized protein n=1 Tax=Moniliophthora roreri TaxID=221103 RepID=A0A0W0FYL4_MONRR